MDEDREYEKALQTLDWEGPAIPEVLAERRLALREAERRRAEAGIPPPSLRRSERLAALEA